MLDRTKEGGHYVDPIPVSSNFYGNLEKLNMHYAMFDTLQIIDTSETGHKFLCVIEQGEVISAVPYHLLPNWFQFNLPKLSKMVRDLEISD